MSQKNERKKEINIFFVIIIILLISVILAFSGFMLLFIKYIDTNQKSNIQNTYVKENIDTKVLNNSESENNTKSHKEEILETDNMI